MQPVWTSRHESGHLRETAAHALHAQGTSFVSLTSQAWHHSRLLIEQSVLAHAEIPLPPHKCTKDQTTTLIRHKRLTDCRFDDRAIVLQGLINTYGSATPHGCSRLHFTLPPTTPHNSTLDPSSHTTIGTASSHWRQRFRGRDRQPMTPHTTLQRLLEDASAGGRYPAPSPHAGLFGCQLHIAPTDATCKRVCSLSSFPERVSCKSARSAHPCRHLLRNMIVAAVTSSFE